MQHLKDTRRTEYLINSACNKTDNATNRTRHSMHIYNVWREHSYSLQHKQQRKGAQLVMIIRFWDIGMIGLCLLECSLTLRRGQSVISYHWTALGFECTIQCLMSIYAPGSNTLISTEKNRCLK